MTCIISIGGSVAPHCKSATGCWRSIDTFPNLNSRISFPIFQVRSVELFGDKFQSLPRLNSDFLITSRQTSRNSLTLKTLSKDATTPSSSPKPKPEVTGSPLLSPRSRSISPQSPLLSSKASSPHSRSSFTLQSKASTSASSKSKCKKVPSPLLLPKSITKLNPSSPVATKMTAKPRLNRAAATKKPLSNKFSSPVPPKEPYTPTSNVFIKNLKEEEHSAPTQTGTWILWFQQVAINVICSF